MHRSPVYVSPPTWTRCLHLPRRSAAIACARSAVHVTQGDRSGERVGHRQRSTSEEVTRSPSPATCRASTCSRPTSRIPAGSRYRSRRKAAAPGTPSSRKMPRAALKTALKPRTGSSSTWAATTPPTTSRPGGNPAMCAESVVLAAASAVISVVRSAQGYEVVNPVDCCAVAWRMISVATTSVIRSVPAGRAMSCSRRVMRTWWAMVSGFGSGVLRRWSL
jgi:hypothetical protein